MVFDRKKARAGENPISPARTQPGKNIREGSNTRRKFFTLEYNDLFIPQVLQHDQEQKSDELHYHVLGFNESSTEDDMKKAYSSLALRFHPGKNQHSQVTEVTKIINEAKEEQESTLHHNDEKWEEEHVHIDAKREEKRFRMAHNAIIISSDDKSDSGRRKIPSKKVTSSNKSSTFLAKHKSYNEETLLKNSSVKNIGPPPFLHCRKGVMYCETGS